MAGLTPTIVFDTTDLKRQAEGYRQAPAALKKAITRTLNRAGDAGLAAVRPALVQQTGITDRSTRRSKGLTKRSAKASDQTYEVVARSQWTPLSYFDPKQSDEGVMASPWGRARVFPRTFMIEFSSGHEGVFKRDMSKPRQTYKPRGGGKPYTARPIVELWGPSIAKELQRGEIPKVFEKRAKEVMVQRMPHELKFALDQIKPRARRAK